MTLRERIKKKVKEKGTSLNKLEEELGFGSGYISKLGKSTPNTAKIQKIAEYLDVSLEWLMTGKEKQIDYLYTDENAEFLIEVTRKAKNNEFVERMMKYMSLTDENRKSIDDMIDFMYEKEKKDEN